MMALEIYSSFLFSLFHSLFSSLLSIFFLHSVNPCILFLRLHHFGYYLSSKSDNLNSADKKISWYDVYSDEDEITTPEEENKLEYSTNDFVLVKLAGKKDLKHYIVLIMSDRDSCGEYIVKYLKRCKDNKFALPHNENSTYVLSSSDIVCKLQQPLLNNRGQYIFSSLPNCQNLE